MALMEKRWRVQAPRSVFVWGAVKSAVGAMMFGSALVFKICISSCSIAALLTECWLSCNNLPSLQ